MTPKEEYHRRNAEKNRREKEKQALRGFGKRTFRNPDRMVRFTWWVAAFTFSLGCVGVLQAWAFIQSERAFVAVEAINFASGDLVPDQPMAFILTFRNSGKSTAFVDDIVLTDFIATAKDDLPETPVYRKLPQHSQPSYPGPVIAGGSSSFTIFLLNEMTGKPMTIDAWDIGFIKSGERTLYVFGYVPYTDEFSIYGFREMGFCYFFNRISDPTISRFTTCKQRAYTYAR